MDKYIFVSIPKSSVQVSSDFETGLYKYAEEDIHQTNLPEFTELKNSIFGNTQFCLLSNFLEVKDTLGKTLKIVYRK